MTAAVEDYAVEGHPNRQNILWVMCLSLILVGRIGLRRLNPGGENLT